MTFGEAVSYYHSLEKFGIMPGLDRISLLCERLGSPHQKVRFIHVAGTNGKGSTCTALASVLTKAGFRTGLYTSPYVIEFRERIRLDSEMISEEDLIKYTELVREAVIALGKENVKITEFEAVTATAFLYYAEKKCDFVVLETGLGGRFDATNIIEAPVCSIITSVSFDHMSVLGNTLSEIAFEKSGIIKKGVPVITGNSQPEEVSVVIRDQAQRNDSDLIIASPDKCFTVLNESIFGTTVDTQYGDFRIPFSGIHQTDNMALVLSCVELLRAKGFTVTDSSVREGIEDARIPARTEIISEKPLVILDGSHNDGSTAALGYVLKKNLKEKKIIALMGMMADKDCEKSLSNVVPCFDTVITTKPSNPRSMSASELAEIVRGFSVQAIPCEDPLDAVELIFSLSEGYDAVVVCGSLYLAGDVRNKLIDMCGNSAI